MDSWIVAGRELLIEGPKVNVWRAPIDNDVHIAREWRKLGLDHLQARVTAFSAEQTAEHAVRVRAEAVYAPYTTAPILRATLTYTLLGNGAVRLTVRYEPAGLMAMETIPLPKLGVQMKLIPALDRVLWYGRGPQENYCDMNAAAPVGKYAADVADLHEPYARPQENGARMDVRHLAVIDDVGAGLMVMGEEVYGDGFSFTAHNYSDQLLTRAKHTTDVHDEEMTVLSLDWRQHGLGSNICGPEPLEKDKLYFTKPVTFQLMIRPYQR
jgi:hypothetical protein